MKLIRKESIFDPQPGIVSCHASTLVVLGEDRVVAAWFAGSKEGNVDVRIEASDRSPGDSGVWSPSTVAGDDQTMPCWNPVLFEQSDESILLFFKIGDTPREWHTMVAHSIDRGRTFGIDEPLVPGDPRPRGPVKNKPILTSEGALLAPSSVELPHWDCFVDVSDDGGKTWTMSGFVPIEGRREERTGVIQPTLWESSPGQIHMLMRSSLGRIYRSDSDDAGVTWSPGYPTAIPNNNSGIDLVKNDDGTLFLVCNPVEENWGARTPLVVMESGDNGDSWSEAMVLEEEPGEYSYPAIASKNGMLHLTYTWRRETIMYCLLEP